VFDKLTNRQAVTHYSRHRLITASVSHRCDYAHVRVNQYPASSSGLPSGHFVKN